MRRWAAIAVGLIASTTLVVWAIGVDAAMIRGPLAPLSPLACLGFLAAAAGVWGIARGSALPVAGGGGAFVAGAAGLADTLVTKGVAINEALFGTPVRISPLTAVALLLLGIAVSLDSRGWPLTRWLTAASGAIGGAAVLGFAFGVPLFYGPLRSVQMSWQAALCVLVLAIGVGAAHPASTVTRLLFDPGLGGRFARRALPAALGIPILSGVLATAAARAGWWPFSVAAWAMTLAAVAGLAIVAAMAVDRLAQEDHRLTQLAIRDPLTGAYNRRHFLAEAQRVAERAQRYGERAAIAVVDIDRFKELNDRWGHAAGDEALVRVYRSLRARLRSSDVLGRLGGDEFAALILHVDEDEGQRIALEMRDAVAVVAGELAAEGRPNRLGASVGVAPLHANDPRDVDDLIDLADQRMYLEKRSRQAPPASTGGVRN